VSIRLNALDATLVLGGARSGKSSRALRLAEAQGAQRLFIATAEPFDVEMRERVQAHRLERGAGWQTRECPLDLAGAIDDRAVDAEPGREPAVLLIDCLTVWLGNLMHHRQDVDAACDALLEAMQRCDVPLVLVSNEVGSGLVPETPVGRRFRDEQGRLNQRLAARCARVELVVAGLPLTLRGGDPSGLSRTAATRSSSHRSSRSR